MNIIKKINFFIAITCAIVALSIDYDRTSFVYGIAILAVGMICGIISAKIKLKGKI